jgi:hypothetical protein
VRSGAADQHDPVVGVADQPNAGLPAAPLGSGGRLAPGEVLVEHAQGEVGQQRRQDSSHATGNFEFEVALLYKRGERPRHTI